MKWPLQKRPIPFDDIPLYDRYYLYAPKVSNVDPVMVMGTEIEADALLDFLRERNRAGGTLITTAHALIRATGLTLAQFPQMNVRLVGRRIYSFKDINIRTAFLHRRYKEIDVMIITSAHTKSLEKIGQEVWGRMLQAGRGGMGRDRDLKNMRKLPSAVLRFFLWFYHSIDRFFPLPALGRLDELRSGATMVNDLSSSGAPPMRMYKPSRFPDNSDSLNLTLGPVETKIVQRDNLLVPVRVMPLFLRADHRLTDAYDVGRFLSMVRELMQNPQRLEGGVDQ